MNIHQLLSTSQSSPQLSSQGAFGQQDSANGLFRQVLAYASGTPGSITGAQSEPSSLQMSSLQAQFQALGSRLAEASGDHLAETLGNHLAEASGDHLAETLGNHLAEASGDHLAETLGNHLAEASGDHLAETLGNHLAEALAGGRENLSEALEALGIDVSEQDLSALLARLQTANSEITTESLAMGSSEPFTQLDEIASRLALMSSFSDNSTPLQVDTPVKQITLESIANHLDISASEAAQLVSALGELTNQPSTTPSLQKEAHSLLAAQLPTPSTIAKHLDIDQSDAEQLVSALSGLPAQNQSTKTLITDTARLVSINASDADMETLQRHQPDHSLPHASSRGMPPQLNSEALMGAMVALESSPKASQQGESLLTGLALNASQAAPLPSAPPAPTSLVSTPAPATLSAPVNSPAWPQQLGQQLVQISQRGGEQHVQLQLNPAELGPLSISLKFGEQSAQAHFLSSHAQVRQILEQAIPQLREALAEQGISLGETSVGEQRDPNAQAFAQSGKQQGAGIEGNDGDTLADETSTSGVESSPVSLDGRVDLYA